MCEAKREAGRMWRSVMSVKERLVDGELGENRRKR